jgi:hypothetical protein
MSLSINTEALTNVSGLSKEDLKKLVSKMDGDGTLSADELLEIAEQLLENDLKSYGNFILTQMIYLLKNQTPNLKHVQNTLLDYIERAVKGKVGGKCRVRKARKTRKLRRIVKRTHRHR